MTEKLKPTTTLAEQLSAVLDRLGLPPLTEERERSLGIPLPPSDAPPPPRPHNETERDDEQRNEESER